MSILTSTPGRVMRITCPCDLAATREATRTLYLFLSQLGVAEDELQAWELIAAEATNNAVEYATGEALKLPVEMIVEVSPTQVELRVLDHTPGFDLPETFELPDPMAEGGRGLFLMSTLSNSLDYLRSRTQNCLVIRKIRAIPQDLGDSGGNALEQATLESTLQSMTEELAASYESLSAIFRFTSELNKGGGGAEFTERWLNELRERGGADWFVLRLVEGAGTHLAVNCTSRPDLNLPVIKLGATDPNAAPAEARAALNHSDVWFDPASPIADSDPLTTIGSPLSGFVHPIYVGTELEGVLAVGRYTNAQAFTAGQVNIIHTISDFLGIQLRNSRIQEDYLRGRLVTRELEIAATIQRSLLPVRLPEPPGYGLAGFSKSASKVGGDFFDVLQVGEEGLLCVIADVMGKGVPAAMFAAIFRSHVRSRPDLAQRPGTFLEWLNTVLFEDLDRVEMFITAQLAFLDLKTHRLAVSSAGHCPLLITNPGTGIREISMESFPLGIDPMGNYGEHSEILQPGSQAIMLTDGLIETRSVEGTLLGLEAVRACLEARLPLMGSAQSTCDALVTLASNFQGAAPASDDLTLLVACDCSLQNSNRVKTLR